MIIGVVGFIGSGKDTVADYLVSHHDFVRDSYAAPLKDAVASIFGWDRELLEGRTNEAREWREQVDEWWTDRLGLQHDIFPITPRYILQQFGTEVLRDHFHEDIWIASLENRARVATKNIVITDCRFPNEFKCLKKAGGKVVRVHRGPDPEWYDYAWEANRGDIEAKFELQKFKVHASETSLVGMKFDYNINNNGTLDDLHLEIDSMIKDLILNCLASKVNLISQSQ